MEKSTPIGIGTGLVLIFGAIFMGEGWDIFFDPASALMVVGGTFAALLVTFSFDEVKQVPPGVKELLSFQPPDLQHYKEMFTEFARLARREGLLALDRRIQDISDDFVRFGLEMAIDGIEEAEIDDLMQMRMREEARQNQFLSKFFVNAGTYAPAFGMVGTLIGLIQMMQNLSDPAQIGAGMAVALITTFYGALLANLVLLPISTKARTQALMKMKARQVTYTGVLSIMRGESPSMVEKRLQSYLDETDAEAAEEPPPSLAKAA